MARPTSSARRAAPTPEEFLAVYPSEVKEAAHALRALVKQTLPTATEAVYPGWKLIGYRLAQQGRDFYVGYIAPLADRVTLGFEQGILMSDPHRLLGGSGTQVRHITVFHKEEIRPAEYSALIREAARVAALSKDDKRRLLLERTAERDAEQHRIVTSSERERD